MTGTIYTSKNAAAIISQQQTSVTTLERDVKTFQPLAQPTVIQELTYQFQGTSFSKMKAQGDARVYATSVPITIDEETNAAVAAYATFDDIGGNGTGTQIADVTISDSFTTASFTTASFASSLINIQYKIPLFDNEGRTAWYQGSYRYLTWEPTLHPNVSHSKQFLTGHSFELNVPGTNSEDRKAFAFYDSHANFNISASVSISLWFYPTDLSQISSETWRTLFYRRIDASNYYAILIKPADSKVYVFVNEAATITKLVSNEIINLNEWNNVIFTYNPSTNALVIYLNSDNTSSTPADSYTPPYTTDAHMYIGGLPVLPDKRFTGYVDNFVFWTGKILTSTETSNMWESGTII